MRTQASDRRTVARVRVARSTRARPPRLLARRAGPVSQSRRDSRCASRWRCCSKSCAGRWIRRASSRRCDAIVRIRAVQDLTPGRGRLLFSAPAQDHSGRASRPATGSGSALSPHRRTGALAFDLYVKCREQTFQVRSNEAKRRVSRAGTRFERRCRVNAVMHCWRWLR